MKEGQGAEDDLREEVIQLRREIEELIATSRALSSERDIRKLLGLILEKCRQVTGADAGSVYVLEGEGAPRDKVLHFMLSQNDSLPIDFQEFTLAVDETSIVGKAVLGARPINIPDLRALEEPGQNPWAVSHDRRFDHQTGYRARSMLTVPMLSAHGDVIGVVQLINRKRQAERRLLDPEDFTREVIAFDARAEELALALASQAGVSLENAILYDEIRKVFEGFVEASVTAIESRDPTTSGHSRRVATLTVELAQLVDASTAEPFASVRFSPEDLRQIEYAGILHDFGKVGVRERVLVKPKKLYEEDLRAIHFRFAYIRKTLEADAAERKLRLVGLLEGSELQARFAEIDAETQGKRAQLDELMLFIARANEPNLLDLGGQGGQGGLARLLEIGQLKYIAPSGEPHPFLEPEEVAALQVRRGTLTEGERVEIESHVIHTANFLKKIPWGRTLGKVPLIAGAHHEYLNGTGYPRGLHGADIPLEARMMTIADIFDALTAADRPYKRAVPIDRALDIVNAEVRAGKLDPDLFQLFVEGEAYKAVL